METKRQQQKMPITKKSDLNLDAFLRSVTCLPLKEINKHFIFNLDDITDVMFSLIDILDFNPINNHHKSRVFSCTNGTIQDITFKFRTRTNMRLIFDSFYAPRKKRRLFNHWNSMMCGQYLFRTFNIKYYIDFLFFSFSFILLDFLSVSFKTFDKISWNFVTLYWYALLIWEIWRFLLMFMCIVWGILSRKSSTEYYQQKRQDSSTENVTVKEDESQKLTKSQDSAEFSCVILSGYDWEYLVEEWICELAASFGVFTYRFIFFVFSFYFYIGFSFVGVLIWYKKLQCSRSLSRLIFSDHGTVAKIGC
jgi:hypothetical protein